MKKTTKKSPMMKIVSAAAMLAVSASMLATSTYAWFSMNTDVTVTAMQLSAKSDDAYLLVNTTGTAASGADTEALTVTEAEAKLYPASPALDNTEAGYLTTSGKIVGTDDAITTAGVVVDNTAKAGTVTNWFTANALAPGAATIDTTTARQLSSFNGYVIHKTCYLTVTTGSNPANNLSVTPSFTQKAGGSDLSAVKAIVCTDDGGFAVVNSTSGKTDIKGNNTNITSSVARQVDIYIYYDGDETPVYTNNMANLKGADITFTFDVESNPSA